MTPLGDPETTPESVSLRRYRMLRLEMTAVMGIAFILFVIVCVQQYQFQNFNRKVDKVGVAATNAQNASDNINKQLTDVINTQINSPQAQEASRQIRQRIINIEWAVCNGPCPDAPVKASSPTP